MKTNVCECFSYGLNTSSLHLNSVQFEKLLKQIGALILESYVKQFFNKVEIVLVFFLNHGIKFVLRIMEIYCYRHRLLKFWDCDKPVHGYR